MWVGRGFKKKRLFSAWVEEALALDLGYTEQWGKKGEMSRNIVYNNIYSQ